MSQIGANISAPIERPLTCLKRKLIRGVEQIFWIKIKGYIKLGISKLCKHGAKNKCCILAKAQHSEVGL